MRVRKISGINIDQSIKHSSPNPYFG